MNTKFIGTKELRQNMAKITKAAQKKNERIIVLRKNEPIFELRPLSGAESLREVFLRDIEQAKQQVKRGETYTQKEVEKMFGL